MVCGGCRMNPQTKYSSRDSSFWRCNSLTKMVISMDTRKETDRHWLVTGNFDLQKESPYELLMMKPIIAVLARHGLCSTNTTQKWWPWPHLCIKVEGPVARRSRTNDNQLARPNCLLIIRGYFLIVATMVAIMIIITNKCTRSITKVWRVFLLIVSFGLSRYNQPSTHD